MVNGYRSISYINGKSNNYNPHSDNLGTDKSNNDNYLNENNDKTLQNLEQFLPSSDQSPLSIETYPKDTTFPSSPKVFGPGIWFDFHTMATLSLTNETIDIYIDHVKSIIDRLPCMKCRRDAQKYFDNDHPSKYKKTTNGMFYWSWKFHNTVNAKLGKPLLDWDTGINMYFGDDDSGVCSLDCGI